MTILHYLSLTSGRTVGRTVGRIAERTVSHLALAGAASGKVALAAFKQASKTGKNKPVQGAAASATDSQQSRYTNAKDITAKDLNNNDASGHDASDASDAAYLAEQAFENAPINWIPAAVLLATPIAAVVVTPWYLLKYGASAQAWGVFAATWMWTGFSVTAGYHRLMSHRAYKAHPSVRNFFLLGATLAVEGSAFEWCSGHRSHHKYVDDRLKDPYSASRGFWFSHIGWMLKKYPSGNFDYKNIPDLTADKLLQIQHKYYGLWVVLTNVGMIGGIGWLVGDVWGTLVLAGLLRLVLNHHFTFFINSLCHMYGTRPYTDSNSARDNFLLAIFTWGEGYHNYHHFFQYDYRNGVKWWQYDPTKWLIAALARLNLASDLRTVDTIKIKHAEVSMQFKRAFTKVESLANATSPAFTAAAFVDRIDNKSPSTDAHASTKGQSFSERISAEYALFNETVKAWQALKAEAIALKKTAFVEHLHEADASLKDKRQQIEQRIKAHQNNVKQAFLSLQQQTS